MHYYVNIYNYRNSIRGIIKHIDNLSTEEIQKVGIPNAIPLVYKFDNKMVPIPNPKESVAPLSGVWLEKQVWKQFIVGISIQECSP